MDREVRVECLLGFCVLSVATRISRRVEFVRWSAVKERLIEGKERDKDINGVC